MLKTRMCLNNINRGINPLIIKSVLFQSSLTIQSVDSTWKCISYCMIAIFEAVKTSVVLDFNYVMLSPIGSTEGV